jgi:hypothetical protein
LKEFGAPLENLTSDDFAHEGYFYQTGKPPLRVDIMMSIPGIEFDVAWQNREVVKLDDLKVFFYIMISFEQKKRRVYSNHRNGTRRWILGNLSGGAGC